MNETALETVSPAPFPSISAEEQAAIALSAATKEQFDALLNSTNRSFQEFLFIITGQNPLAETQQNAPVWVQNSAARIRRSFFPTLKRGENPESPFYDGKLLGHFAHILNRPDLLSEIEKSDNPNVSAAMGAIMESLKSMVALGLNGFLKAPLETQQEFFKGFSFALSKPLNLSDIMNSSSSFMAEFLMIAAREEISKMTSTDQLHNWLEQNLGHNLAGSLARTQKLCQRIGLRLGPKGRPRKNNRTTTKTRCPI